MNGFLELVTVFEMASAHALTDNGGYRTASKYELNVTVYY